MPDLFSSSIEDQIACVIREITYRERVYARRVDAGKMTQRLADRELHLMKAVLDTLRLVWAGSGRPHLED